MKVTPIAAAAVCLLVARAPPAAANVTYRWSDPSFTQPFSDSSITVTDAAYRSGSLDFGAYCLTNFPPCVPYPPDPGWVSGFGFPAYDSAAQIDLAFDSDNLLTGSIRVDLNSDYGYRYEGSGMDWTATFIQGLFSTTETGFFQRVDDPPSVPEPAAIAMLLAGIAGLAFVQQKRRQTRA